VAGSLRRVAGWLLATSLIVPCLGCGCYSARHGLILRGDWSFEINRVPWLAGRSIAHQETTEGECAVSEGGCGEVPPGGCGPAGGGSPTPAAVYPGPGGVGCRTVGPGARCAQMGRAGGANAGASQAGYYNHPRFHPVPTHPVFSPDGQLAAAPGPMVIPEADIELQPAGPPAPLPTAEPEAIPTPSGDSSSQWRTRQAEPKLVAAQPSWIFVPAGEQTPAAPERRAAQPPPSAKAVR
jgi:hypothetical protein